jgi:solute carrier family 66, member 2
LEMVVAKQVVDIIGFVFFLTSPLTSYGDQILSMRRRKSSAGFSIDVSGIMLVARSLYYPPPPIADTILMPVF